MCVSCPLLTLFSYLLSYLPFVFDFVFTFWLSHGQHLARPWDKAKPVEPNRKYTKIMCAIQKYCQKIAYSSSNVTRIPSGACMGSGWSMGNSSVVVSLLILGTSGWDGAGDCSWWGDWVSVMFVIANASLWCCLFLLLFLSWVLKCRSSASYLASVFCASFGRSVSSSTGSGASSSVRAPVAFCVGSSQRILMLFSSIL